MVDDGGSAYGSGSRRLSLIIIIIVVPCPSCRVRWRVLRKFGSASEASSRAHRCTCSAA